MTTNILFFILVLTTYRSLGYSSINTVIVAGNRLIIVCRIHGEGIIHWKFRSTHNSQEDIIFNGYSISKHKSQYSVSERKGEQFDLMKGESQPEDAGTYTCTKRIKDRQAFRTEDNIMQLTVLASDTECYHNASARGVVEGDYIRLWCNVNYTGSLVPKMKWSRNDGKIATSRNVYYNTTVSFILISETILESTSDDHNVIYFCMTYFDKPSIVPQNDNIFTATNAPDYKYEWHFRLNILFGPKNVSIMPRKKRYSKGDRLHCSALGNPAPMYTWKEIGTNNIIEGSNLTISERMESFKEQNYNCIAENTVDGRKMTASDTISIYVGASPWYSSGENRVVLVVGVVASVGGIAITIAVVCVWKLVKRKCIYAVDINSKDRESNGARDSPHDYESVNSEEMDVVTQTPDLPVVTREGTMNEVSGNLAESGPQYNRLGLRISVQESPSYNALAPTISTGISNSSYENKPRDYYNAESISINIIPKRDTELEDSI